METTKETFDMSASTMKKIAEESVKNKTEKVKDLICKEIFHKSLDGFFSYTISGDVGKLFLELPYNSSEEIKSFFRKHGYQVEYTNTNMIGVSWERAK